MSRRLIRERVVINRIKRDLADTIDSFLFEMNNDQTRRSVKKAFEAVLNQYIDSGALYDWCVVCGDTNNPPSIINEGKLQVEAAVKFNCSAEFYYLNVCLSRLGTNVHVDRQQIGDYERAMDLVR